MTFAVVAGALASIGGGSAVVGGALVAMGTSTALSAYGSIQSGKAQQDELNRQAEEEKIAAEGRELERKQQLNRVLAANAVSQSMSGITGEGTPASIALESAKQIGSSEGMINLSEKLKRAQLRRQGANARSGAGIQAASTLLSGASTFAMAYAKANPKTPEE
tara:strand:- start:1886 stop:2374 length:489 start_codon:yes stop_codon:yes gene_type:complete